jgi:hypothetical protein
MDVQRVHRLDEHADVVRQHLSGNESAANVTSVTSLWYGVVAGGGHSYPSPAFTGWDGCHTRPASLQRLVILVETL